MQESELIVRRIREGTVIDHIDEGQGLQVLNALGINGAEQRRQCPAIQGREWPEPALGERPKWKKT